MKSKLNLTAKTTSKLTLRKSLVYAAAGLGIVAILFTGAFLYFNLGNSEEAVASTGDGVQFNITSTDGYTIKIQMEVVKVIVPNSCVNGYNYNFQIDYNIIYSGNNIPSNLWTLQANIIHENGKHWFSIPTNAKGTGTIITTNNSSTNKTDCATATPASFGVSNIELLIQGSGISTQTILGDPVALPIVLSDFQASITGSQTVQVEWSTFAEKNNDFFTVERSADGKNFEVLTTVDGAGNSNKKSHYSFEDKQPLAGYNYYRLKQTDFNGDYEYFKIVAVNNSQSKDKLSAKAVHINSAWPNPFTDHLNITFDAAGDGELEVLIQNVLGEVVHKTLFPFYYGENTYAFDHTTGLKPGIYFVTLGESGKKLMTQKVIKI